MKQTTSPEPGSVSAHEVESVSLAALVPHPRNYREHPDDEIEHLQTSLKEHGLYRNVVIARDGTILAGHGVVKAARGLGMTEILAVRLPIDPDSAEALKVLIGDNEIEHLAEQDDRLLSELLKEIGETDLAALMGTGYDQAMLANLVMVTRPASEIRDFDAAAHWVGMPEHGDAQTVFQINISFASEADRDRFMAQNEMDYTMSRRGAVWSLWWPEERREDLASLRYEAADGDQ